MLSSNYLRVLTTLMFSVLLATSSFAGDDTHGFLTGTVSDPSGGALPGVTVSAYNEDKGVTRTAVTDGEGTFRIRSLVVGNYTVTAVMTGFQTAKRSNVLVGLGGKTAIALVLQPGDVSEVMVVTSSELLVDTSTTTTGLTVRTDELMERIPVPRDQTSVALLAPGSTQGDTAFDSDEEGANLASIGGASVAENSYLVNGLNTTNFRNGLGGSNVPFEFLQELEVKTGGYQAEFGRSTGGVINTVTKSGGNDLHYGMTFYFEPESLAETEEDTFARINSFEEYEVLDFNAYVSGPIVKDKAFFYVLYNPRDNLRHDTRLSRDNKFESDDAFWGAKLDWHITPEHMVEFTAFSDEQTAIETTSAFDADTGLGDLIGLTEHDRGGENMILKYTGLITSNFSFSAQYGINKFNRTSLSDKDNFPRISDIRSGANVDLGSWSNSAVVEADDERRAFRLDFDYFLGDHTFRAGFDIEQNESNDSTQYSGGIWWRYEPGSAWGLPDGTDAVRERIFIGGGSFDTDTNAIYIQDSWAINENFTFNIGLRNESFDNKNANGDTFIKIDDQLAPRVGFIWDPSGEGRTKVYASYGKYYLPIAANTNIRLAGAEFFTEEYLVVNSINADDTPNTGASLDFDVFGDGEVPDTSEILDTGIEPMFQNEFILGYDTKFGENWAFGARAIHRNLGQSIEDIAVDAALNRYVEENFGISNFGGGFDFYVLANPGTDLTFSTDVDGDGNLDEITLLADELGYPKSERDYYAVELTVNRRYADNWMLQGSYTWSHSYGNNEGYVRSDNGQDDAGLTTNFDQPGLTDGGFGNLPNDRRHNFKLFGSYAFENRLAVGAFLSVQSGRPKNSFGTHPTDDFAAAYGRASFFDHNFNLVPRGSLGNTPTVSKVDLMLQYPISFGRGDLNLRLDVFNAFDFDTETEVYELAQLSTTQDIANSTPHPNFGDPTHYQSPRRVRISAELRF